MQNKVQPTLINHYVNGDEEYVFCVKSRPFACLVSPHLPTPTTSLIDYNLISSLGLKMSDLQCQKFYFGGHKMRILGKVSLTVQTIQDGLSYGNFHIKANVVTDLTKNFETDCVAGLKTKNQLRAKPSPPQARTPASSPFHARTSASTPPQARPPAPPSTGRPSPAPSSGRPSPPPSPPPGFPQSPQYITGSVSLPTPLSPHVAVSLSTAHGTMSPLSANIHSLHSAFFGADTEPDPNAEVNAILRHDDKGDLGLYDNLQMRYLLSNGLVYRTGHGRGKCSYNKCVIDANDVDDDVSHNCGFHPQWMFPPWFKCCGSQCRGAFCPCLRNYEFN